MLPHSLARVSRRCVSPSPLVLVTFIGIFFTLSLVFICCKCLYICYLLLMPLSIFFSSFFFEQFRITCSFIAHTQVLAVYRLCLVLDLSPLFSSERRIHFFLTLLFISFCLYSLFSCQSRLYVHSHFLLSSLSSFVSHAQVMVVSQYIPRYWPFIDFAQVLTFPLSLLLSGDYIFFILFIFFYFVCIHCFLVKVVSMYILFFFFLL